MGKILKYQEIIQKLLEEYASIKPVNWGSAEHQVILDEKNHHYQLVRLGWRNDQYFHYAIFHFDIREGKIWVRQNRTDVNIEEELVELGVSPDDILISYREPGLLKHKVA